MLSGLLLVLAFPPFESAQLAWVALIPLLLALLHQWNGGLAVAFRLGFVTGLVFWLATMSWMLRLFETSPAPLPLIVVGWGLLAAYCALYLGAFAMTVVWAARKIGVGKLWQNLLLTLLIPVFWAGGEIVRSYFLTGFPWDLLAISQFRSVALIQSAQWVGVAGVSAILMLVNAGLAFTVTRYLPPREKGYRPHLELFVALLTLALCFRSGLVLVRQYQAPAEDSLEVAAVQPAIPQVKKWSQEQIDLIHSSFRRLTTRAVAAGPRPSLVIWPETATPYCVTEEGESKELVEELSRLGVPLLVGSMDIVPGGREPLCFNGSFLVETNGSLGVSYYKQHLVPFGEYIPLSGVIPPLAALAPMGWNCTAGTAATVFRVGEPGAAFSCLICFEDIMAGLSRAFVKAGARLLVNQTNDAWFDRSAGPVQHLSHCVFRCVENRIPAVRVGNSGISCLILPTGQVVDATENGWSRPPTEEVLRWQVPLSGAAFEMTPYTRYGDWLFGIPCAFIALVALGFALGSLRIKKS